MADNRIYYPQQPVLPIGKAAYNPKTSNSSKPVAANEPPFSQVLGQELTGLKFSQHALDRLETRNIALNKTDLAKISGAVEKAAQKGARESLILMDNLALVVSVKNRTVITAMDGGSVRDNVFTNIDSAVII
ncbi:MAG: flagellar operon protein [Firmicutes bacterium]|nr:flagellar operon protein [Bacillota bacterium]